MLTYLYLLGSIVGFFVQFVLIPYGLYRLFKWKGRASLGKKVAWGWFIALVILNVVRIVANFFYGLF